MATTQQKRLKATLIQIGAEHRGKISVTTDRRYIGRYNGKAQYEFGYARSMVDKLTDEQERILRDRSPFVEITKCCVGEEYEFWEIRD